MEDDAIQFIRSYMQHIVYVQAALERIVQELRTREHLHDISKLNPDEFSGFVAINKSARDGTFGTPAYAESIKARQEVVDLHYSRNRHHPKCFTSPETMKFIDIIEMVCDWHGAHLVYTPTKSWATCIETNIDMHCTDMLKEQHWLIRQIAGFLAPLS
jgi:hypothetical protein